MEVEKKFVIDGILPVDFEIEFAGIQVYSQDGDGSKTLYFTENDKVIKALIVSADCKMNMGYISRFEFVDPE